MNTLEGEHDKPSSSASTMFLIFTSTLHGVCSQTVFTFISNYYTNMLK